MKNSFHKLLVHSEIKAIVLHQNLTVKNNFAFNVKVHFKNKFPILSVLKTFHLQIVFKIEFNIFNVLKFYTFHPLIFMNKQEFSVHVTFTETHNIVLWFYT